MLDLSGLHLRAAFLFSVRKFFATRNFLEVDTPIRQPVVIPEANIVPIECDGYLLQSSPELFMKRLLAFGCTDIFQICKCFRKNECGRLHLEEFQMLEWYRTGADYLHLMEDCKELIQFVESELNATGDCPKEGAFFSNCDLSAEWSRITVTDAFREYAPMPLRQAISEHKFDQILVEYVEPKLGHKVPTILYDYPLELGSLAKQKPENSKIVERFELYLNGVELANGFSELTDAGEQRRRFTEEIDQIRIESKRESKMPEKFLDDIEKIEKAAGIALGLDRLFMLAMNEDELEKVVSFGPGDF